MINSRKSINDLPIAESTLIEDSSRQPKSSVLSWSRFGLRNRSASPGINQTHVAKKKAQINQSPLSSRIDPRVVLDAQSNGFAARVVKYHDESEAKTREISNKTYRRPGDFPIVNLEKIEHSLKKRPKATQQISTMSLSTPINLVNASERSAIFRTGKNLGEALASVPNETSLKLGRAQNEPIIPLNNEFDNGLACSSLDALKEISRKRIHYDELDGDQTKKTKPEYGHIIEPIDAVPISSKRPRERVSPTVSSPIGAQNKRYRNNDILSSLSSSISMGIKRTASALAESTPIIARQRSDVVNENAVKTLINDHAHLTNNIIQNASGDAIRRIGKSNSDIPPCQATKQPEQVLKSMSDSSVSNQRKPPKLTLFNKDYNRNEPTYDGSEDEDRSDVSYVKPKARTSSLFSLSKERDPSKSKLTMMLNFLRGQDSTDEVDTAKVNNSAKPRTDPKENVESAAKTSDGSKHDVASKTDDSSKAPSLATTTNVTFSTATAAIVSTTQSPNVSSPIVETPKKDKPSAQIEAPSGTVAKPLSTAPIVQASPSKAPEVPKIQFQISSSSSTVNTISPKPAAIVTTSASDAATESTPRFGGFAFGATTAAAQTTAATLPTVSVSPAKPTLATTAPAGFTLAAPIPATTFSTAQPLPLPPTLFGKTADTTAKTHTFGGLANNSSASTVQFNSGQSTNAAQPNSISGQTLNTPAATQPTFSFGGIATAAATTASTAAPVPVLSSAPSTPSGSFVFGASNINKPNVTPAFGSVQSPASVAATPNATAPSTVTPTFGGAAKSFTFSAPPSYAASATNSPIQFGGSQATSAASSTNAFSVLPSTTSSPSANLLGAVANKPATGAFSFGGASDLKPSISMTPTAAATSNPFGMPAPQSASTAAPGPFGMPAMQPAAAAPPNPFGVPASQPTTTSNAPTFGQNAPTFGQKSSAFSFTAPNTATSTANATPIFGSSAQPAAINNPFGGPQTNQTSLSNTTSNTAPPAFGTSSTFSFTANSNAAFGSQAAASPFGASNTNLFSAPASNTQSSQSTPNVFGQPSAFGQTSTPAPSSTFGAAPVFGSNAGGGSNSAFTSAPKPANSMFGSGTNSPPSAAFSFGGSTASNNVSSLPPSFGSASSAASFGGNTNNNAGGAFAFGGNTANEPAKAFNFGGAATPATPTAGNSPYAFGGAPAAAPVPNAFQFNAQPQANIFSITPNTGAPKNRPVRTLSRRNK